MFVVRISIATVLLSAFATLPVFAAEPTGYIANQKVEAATRLDWVFPLANQSPAKLPDGFLPNYSSTEQTYELYVPKDYDESKAYPVLIYISPGSRGDSFPKFSKVCRDQKMIFISPRQVGNNVAMQRRVRITMDALDNVRRKYKVDADRTYISGFSGGGRVACAIAFATPEYFGGVMPFCAGGQLRQEVWLQHRVIDRLRVALVTGETDFNRGEVERLTTTMLSGQGVTVKTWVVPNLGHGVPGSDAITKAVEWMEAGVEHRRALAKKYPATRISNAPSRRVQAALLLAEADDRISSRKTLYSGLMQMKGIYRRWNDLLQAQEALEVLQQYEGDKRSGWEAEDVANLRQTLIARARAVDAYGSGPLPKQYAAQQTSMLQAAISLWEQVIKDGQDAKAVREAKTRIPKLSSMLVDLEK